MTAKNDLRKGFTLGPWEVLPDRGLLRDGKSSEHLEPLVMRVLVALAAEQGEVLSKDRLIEIVWEGRALSDEPLNRCISILRKKLGDDSRSPLYIQNIPRLGYRLMMPIGLLSDNNPEPRKGISRQRSNWLLAVFAAFAIIVFAFGLRYFNATDDQQMRSIAIYPFTCSGVTEDYLCFGFSEELASTLLQSAEIKIVKLRQPLPSDPSPVDIAKALDVGGLLTGSVQQVGDRMRIAAELIDGTDGSVRMLDTLDGFVSEVFDLQEQVAANVEQAMFGSTSTTLRTMNRPATFAAYEAYARGQFLFERRSRSAIEESIRLFEQTTELDPSFGPAYLRLAYGYLLMPEYDSGLSVQAMYDRAAATVAAGIEADPGIREIAATVFGFIHHKRGEWGEAEAAFENAVNAETVYPLTYNWYSRFLATTGQLDDALRYAQLAYERAPDNATMVSRLAITNLWVSELDAAGRYFDIANEMGQESPIHDLAYALYLIRVGDIDAAAGFTKTGLDKYGFRSDWVDAVYEGIEDPKKRERSITIVSELETSASVAHFITMTLWAVLGEAERAFATAMSIEGIGQDFETGYEVMFSDDLAILRAHPDFDALLRSTGLHEYWAGKGCNWSDDRLICD